MNNNFNKKHRIRILLVEDERITAMDEVDLLEGMGYQVVATAASGEEAIRLVSQKRPDLVLMDIMLDGEMDGIEAAQTIRSLYQTPVIFVTAHADKAVVERAKKSQPSGYVLKPFNCEILASNIELALYRHVLDQRLRDNQAFLQVVTSVLAEGLLVLDPKNRPLFMNPEAEQLLGWSLDDLKHGSLHQKIHRNSEGGLLEQSECSICRAMTKQQRQSGFDEFFLCKDGSLLPVSYSAAPMYKEGKFYGIVVAFQDVSQYKQLVDQLEQLARHDSLTGLYNRGAFEWLMKEQLAYAKRYQTPLSLIMIDVDHFKKINDQHGHQAGDQVLQQLTRQIANQVRQTDYPARFGGEEFVIILPHTAHQQAVDLAERIRLVIAETPMVCEPQKSVSITISLGVASFREGVETLDVLVKAADQALFQAKAEGRNRVVSADALLNFTDPAAVESHQQSVD